MKTSQFTIVEVPSFDTGPLRVWCARSSHVRRSRPDVVKRRTARSNISRGRNRRRLNSNQSSQAACARLALAHSELAGHNSKRFPRWRASEPPIKRLLPFVPLTFLIYSPPEFKRRSILTAARRACAAISGSEYL
jgi:hypothetical protein